MLTGEKRTARQGTPVGSSSRQAPIPMSAPSNTFLHQGGGRRVGRSGTGTSGGGVTAPLDTADTRTGSSAGSSAGPPVREANDGSSSLSPLAQEMKLFVGRIDELEANVSRSCVCVHICVYYIIFIHIQINVLYRIVLFCVVLCVRVRISSFVSAPNDLRSDVRISFQVKD